MADEPLILQLARREHERVNGPARGPIVTTIEDGIETLARQITIYGRLRTIVCDGHCAKAWGCAGGRPLVQFTPGDVDDYAYLADNEIPSGTRVRWTSEGDHGKPTTPEQRLDDRHIKWCARACERAALTEDDGSLKLHDFTRRVYNRHDRQRAADEAHARGAPDPNGPGVRVLRP